MNFNEYQNLALRTANKELTDKELMLNGVLGLCGEAGEVADVIKKYLFQGHDFDREKVIDEMGDVLWYLAILSHSIGATLEDIPVHNVNKLMRRYPEGFKSINSTNRVE